MVLMHLRKSSTVSEVNPPTMGMNVLREIPGCAQKEAIRSIGEQPLQVDYPGKDHQQEPCQCNCSISYELGKFVYIIFFR